MYNKLFYRLFYISFKLGYYTGVSSFLFIKKTKRLIIYPKALVKQIITGVLITIAAIYYFLATLYICLIHKFDNTTQSLCIILSGITIMMTYSFWTFYFNQERIVEATHLIIDFAPEFQRMFLQVY